MAHWVRIAYQGRESFGLLEGETVRVHAGSLFAAPKPTGETIPLGAARVLMPTVPGKMVALVDNYHALVAKLKHAVPAEPLYFLKGNNSFLAHGETIRTPGSYAGKVVYEGELGIVIGRRASSVSETDATHCIFGYTCINDVTAIEILNKDPGFAQWTRAKSFDTFGVIGPVIATGLDPGTLTVKTVLNDQERQNYPLSDIIFPPAKLVSLVSRDMTLEPGDVIACGTSVGVGSMKPGSTVSSGCWRITPSSTISSTVTITREAARACSSITQVLPKSCALPSRSARAAWITATSGRAAGTSNTDSPVKGQAKGRAFSASNPRVFIRSVPAMGLIGRKGMPRAAATSREVIAKWL